MNALQAYEDGLLEDKKLAGKLQTILDSVSKGVRYLKPNTNFPEMIPLYEVSRTVKPATPRKTD